MAQPLLPKLSLQVGKDRDCESIDVLCNQWGNKPAQKKFLHNCEEEGEEGEEGKGRECVKKAEICQVRYKVDNVHRTQSCKISLPNKNYFPFPTSLIYILPVFFLISQFLTSEDSCPIHWK